MAEPLETLLLKLLEKAVGQTGHKPTFAMCRFIERFGQETDLSFAPPESEEKCLVVADRVPGTVAYYGFNDRFRHIRGGHLVFALHRYVNEEKAVNWAYVVDSWMHCQDEKRHQGHPELWRSLGGSLASEESKDFQAVLERVRWAWYMNESSRITRRWLGWSTLAAYPFVLAATYFGASMLQLPSLSNLGLFFYVIGSAAVSLPVALILLLLGTAMHLITMYRFASTGDAHTIRSVDYLHEARRVHLWNKRNSAADATEQL